MAAAVGARAGVPRDRPGRLVRRRGGTGEAREGAAALPRPAPGEPLERPRPEGRPERARGGEGGSLQVAIGGRCRSTPKSTAGQRITAMISDSTSDRPATLL